MKARDLQGVLYSTHGLMQFGIVAEECNPTPIEQGGTVDYYLEKYADKEVKRIFAENDYIVIVLRKCGEEK